MITSIEQFLISWKYESGSTRKVFAELTDESLNRELVGKQRTLGRLAWHITQTIPEMLGKTGLKPDGPAENEPVPATADEIRKAYDAAASSVLEQVSKNWNDDSLQIEDEMYGEKWKRGNTLSALLNHQIHHRGQMTIMMRLAGLKVPGVYGPSREEWAQFGMKEPEI